MRRPTLLLASVIVTAFASASAQAWAADADNANANSNGNDNASAAVASLAANIDGEIHRAEALRTDGKLTDAAHAFAQLVLVAPDDARVVGEYGKTLAEEGRGDDAAAFLERAIEINPGEWTYFSALGVAYDEQGRMKDAQLAYKHALLLKPGDASVMNNLALSRMLSGDISGAHTMILQAKAADSSDEKIARNVELVESRMPQQKALSAIPSAALVAAQPVTVAAVPPAPKRSIAPERQIAHPRAARITAEEPTASERAHTAPPALRTTPDPITLAAKEPPSSMPVAVGAPRVLSNIVMQSVPADPLAGPVADTKAARAAVTHRAAKATSHAPAGAAAPTQAADNNAPDKKAKVPALRPSADDS